MRHLKGVAAGLVALLMAMLAGSAFAASGTALGVDPQAEVSTKGKLKVLTVGADIFVGDNVKTGPDGQVQIRFSDKTELVVGPNSSLTIEDYLLRDDQSAGKFAINALAGTFRFATGEAAKDRYIIKTPGGTIGVRGTAFDFNVDGEDTEVLLFHGTVLLCNLSQQCVTLDGSCEIGSYDLSEAITVGAASDTSGEQRREFKEAFKYAQSQTPLMREFWVTSARQCFNQGFVNDTPPSLVEGDNSPAPPPEQKPEPDECEEGELYYEGECYGDE